MRAPALLPPTVPDRPRSPDRRGYLTICRHGINCQALPAPVDDSQAHDDLRPPRTVEDEIELSFLAASAKIPLPLDCAASNGCIRTVHHLSAEGLGRARTASSIACKSSS